MPRSIELFVDSRTRDRTSYPNPEKFSIKLGAPINGVVAVDVTDVVLRKTMYAVDHHNNRISLTAQGMDTVDLHISPGNHTPDTLVDEINSSLASNRMSGGVRCKHLSNPFEVTGKVIFHAPVHFVVHVQKSTASDVLGFYRRSSNDVSSDETRSSYLGMNGFYIPETLTKYPVSTEHFNTRSDPPDDAMLVPISDVFGVSQEFSVSSRRFRMEGVHVRFDRPSTIYSGYSKMRFDVRRKEDGGIVYEGYLFATDVNDNVAYGSTGGTMCSEGNFVLTVWGTDALDSFIFTGMISSDDDPSNVSFPAAPRYIRGPSSERKDMGPVAYSDILGSENYKTRLVLRLDVSPAENYVIPPGVVDLKGETNVILRCVELEEAIGASHAYSHAGGIAQIRLADSGGQVTKVMSRYATPRSNAMSNVEKLSFQFEVVTEDGGRSLYDCKGINNSVALTITVQDPVVEESQIHDSPAYVAPRFMDASNSGIRPNDMRRVFSKSRR